MAWFKRKDKKPDSPVNVAQTIEKVIRDFYGPTMFATLDEARELLEEMKKREDDIKLLEELIKALEDRLKVMQDFVNDIRMKRIFEYIKENA